MKTTNTQNTPSGQQTTVEIDGDTVARFFGPDSKEMAGRFNNDRAELERVRAELRELRLRTQQTDGPCPTCGSTILAGRMAHHQSWCKAEAAKPAADKAINLTAYQVFYEDGSSYVTSMAAGVTLAEARAYFVGQWITQPDESKMKVVDVQPCNNTPTAPAAAQLEELFRGGPPLPATHWMEKYAKASAELARLREELKHLGSACDKFRIENKRLRDVEAGAAAMREALSECYECGLLDRATSVKANIPNKYRLKAIDAISTTAGRDLLQQMVNLEYSNESHRQTSENWRDKACKSDALLAEVEKLRTALAPFAELLGDEGLQHIGVGTQIAPTITVQMVKDAKAALTKAVGK